TGNNVAIYGDLTRRTLVCNLDPQQEQPETRAFKGNPVVTVLADRGKYIAACLTICRAYMLAEGHDKPTPLASFEGWSDIVRSALLWLEEADPVASLDIGRDDDPERNALLDLMTAWDAVFGRDRGEVTIGVSCCLCGDCRLTKSSACRVVAHRVISLPRSK